MMQHTDCQLTFPYTNSIKIDDDNVKLTYISKISEDRDIFRATLGDGPDSREVIIKFVQHYAVDCHKACHELGFSPELIACEPIAGGWYIVVIEFLEDYEPLSEIRRHSKDEWQVIKIETMEMVTKMHSKGFVHGDMRLPNILIKESGSEHSLKIIDFDWAGMLGEAKYPPFLNQEINWHPDVGFGKKIKKEHDLHLIDMEFQYYIKT